MKSSIKELQKIRGIGEVLAKRLVEAGHDSYEKLHALGEEGLRAIKGINPKAVKSILAQAAEFAESARKRHEVGIEELRAATGRLKERVEEIARSLKESLTEQVEEGGVRKLEKQISKILVSIEKVEGKLGKRRKRTARGISRAEARLAGLAEGNVKKAVRGIRRARKALKRIYA